MPEEARGNGDELQAARSVVVCVVGNMVEAQLAEDALAEAGIPCVVESFTDAAWDGAMKSQKGWGCVRVSAADLARARGLIEEALAPAEDTDDLIDTAEADDLDETTEDDIEQEPDEGTEA